MLDDPSRFFKAGPDGDDAVENGRNSSGKNPDFAVQSSADKPGESGYLYLEPRSDRPTHSERREVRQPSPMKIASKLLDDMKLEELKAYLNEQKGTVGSLRDIVSKGVKRVMFPFPPTHHVNKLLRLEDEKKAEMKAKDQQLSNLAEIKESIKKDLSQLNPTKALQTLEKNYTRMIEMQTQELVAEAKYSELAGFLQQFEKGTMGELPLPTQLYGKVKDHPEYEEALIKFYNEAIISNVKKGFYGKAIKLARKAQADLVKQKADKVTKPPSTGKANKRTMPRESRPEL